MAKKLTDPKTIEKLAMLAAKKTGPADHITDVTKRVIANYFSALEVIQQYNDSLTSEENAFKLLQEKKRKEKMKAKKQTVNE